MKTITKTFAFVFCFFITQTAFSLSVTVYSTTDATKKIGVVTLRDTSNGLEITPNLSHLKPGAHGFHIHQRPSCEQQGMAAKGHFDPNNTNSHLGPYKNGHEGDLPKLMVNKKGQADTKVTAPRLSVDHVKGHALMIHEGGDNYSNTPPLGGGGKRIACGVIQ